MKAVLLAVAVLGGLLFSAGTCTSPASEPTSTRSKPFPSLSSIRLDNRFTVLATGRDELNQPYVVVGTSLSIDDIRGELSRTASGWSVPTAVNRAFEPYDVVVHSEDKRDCIAYLDMRGPDWFTRAFKAFALDAWDGYLEAGRDYPTLLLVATFKCP